MTSDKGLSSLSPEAKRKIIARFSERQGVDDKASRTDTAPAAPAGRQGQIPESHYRPDQFSAYKQIEMHRLIGEHANLSSPFFKVHDGVAADTTVVDGRELLNFSSYNYLGINGDPRVGAAAVDLILHDRLIHNSVLVGAQMTGASRMLFPHNDWRAVDAILFEQRGRYEKILICVEGMYSMDGDICPLERFVEVKNRHKALLMVDEAHSVGVLGATGRGIGEHTGVVGADVDIWMGTLSKTFSACGGYIAGEAALIELLRYSAPGFVYSVGMSPPIAAAALESLRILLMEPERVALLQRNGAHCLAAMRARNLDTAFSQGFGVVPVVTGSSMLAVQMSNTLFDRGISVAPIIYPAVEEGRARLRFFMSSAHKPEQIEEAADAVALAMATLSKQ